MRTAESLPTRATTQQPSVFARLSLPTFVSESNLWYVVSYSKAVPVCLSKILQWRRLLVYRLAVLYQCGQKTAIYVVPLQFCGHSLTKCFNEMEIIVYHRYYCSFRLLAVG